MISLRGITWDHPRGYRGLEAATAAFMQLYPDVRVRWERHSLGHFESHPIGDVAARYDLLIVDHPFVGEVARSKCLLNLEEHAESLEISQWADDVVGRSLVSYRYGGALWALPVDAACQASVYRPDLMPPAGPPRDWQGVLALARERKLAIAYKGVHGLLVMFALCANLGQPPFAEGLGDSIDISTGEQALGMMFELCAFMPPEVVDWNAIALLDAMRTRDDLAFCPLVFTYSAYSHAPAARSGAHALRFGEMPGVHGPDASGSVLGGTGFAVSRNCQHVQAAVALGGFLMRRETQIGMGLQEGQPARRSAWLSPELNLASGDFYRSTLSTLQAAYLRPRHAGYMAFQWQGGQIVEEYLRTGGNARATVLRLNALYQQLVRNGE